MDAHIEPDWITMGHRVTIYERGAGAVRVLHFNKDGQRHWVSPPREGAPCHLGV